MGNSYEQNWGVFRERGHQPTYDDASGGYRGTQQLYTHDAAGRWSLVRQVRVPDSFVFHSAHGHFHFPLASFGLYSVAPDGGVGSPVALSPKNGFCIDDSFIADTTLEHSGAFVGTRGSCADPSSLRGMSVGAIDEYDYRDPGQAIPIDALADGTYWFRAMTDPFNDLVEADESNNETDVRVTIANGAVTPGAVTHPDTPPPAISLTSPSDGERVAGAVTLSADTLTSGGVQFLVDGSPVSASSQTASRSRSTGTAPPSSTAHTGSRHGRRTAEAGRTPRPSRPSPSPTRPRRRRGARSASTAGSARTVAEA